MAKNDRETKSDRQMMNSNGHIQHKHGEKVPEMEPLKDKYRN